MWQTKPETLLEKQSSLQCLAQVCTIILEWLNHIVSVCNK